MKASISWTKTLWEDLDIDFQRDQRYWRTMNPNMMLWKHGGWERICHNDVLDTWGNL